MLFFVLGAPGRFSAWCEALIAEMAGGPDNPAPIVSANTLADVALGALRRQATQFVVSTPQPTGALRNALVAAGHHVVVALDEPRAALLELVLRQAWQFQTRCSVSPAAARHSEMLSRCLALCC